MKDQYKREVIDPGDQISRLAHEINLQSYGNCPAVLVVPHQPGNFRGPVGFTWKPSILKKLAEGVSIDPVDGKVTGWRMLQEIENDGAGGKPQFFTLIGTPAVFRNLGWEIITMTADDFARSGRFPAIIVNEMNVKRITAGNIPLLQAALEGYGEALKQAGLVNITGETAVMKHSITAFCDTDSLEQLILTWGATCLGLAYHNLLIDGLEIQPGMPIVGFWEPGYRCNGGTFFTNVILQKFGPTIDKIRSSHQAMEFIQKLTIPSKSYARTITRIVGWNSDGNIHEPLAEIRGIAHITGGGVWGKFGEILPPGVGAYLHSLPEPAEVLRQGQELSWEIPELKLTDYQAYGTLHGGCGMLIIAASENDASRIITEATQDQIKAQIVGETTDRHGEILIRSRFKEGKTLSSLRPD